MRLKSDVTPERIVECPRCRQQAAFGPVNPWRPFCSQRCRNLDLGAWANEDYRVAASPDPPQDAEPGPDAANVPRPPAH